MKKIIVFAILMLFFLLNCKKDDVTTAPVMPIAEFSISSEVNGIVSFTNSSKNATTYEWDFGDNTTKSTEKNPSHTYTVNGKYKVSLKATNTKGSNSIEQEVSITSIIILPTATFSFSGDVNGKVSFTNSSKNATTYEWDFGDNTAKSTEKDPSHTYIINGKYKVSLKATSSTGTSSIEQEVSITSIIKPSTEKELISFAVNFKSFSGESVTTTGKKSGNSFSIFLPPNIDYKTVKPTFSISDKAKIFIDNVAQVSDQTVIDLSKANTYTIEAEDKSKQSFTITPIIINDPIDKIINAFIQKYNVTGLTFSMTNKEKLVYSKGYGIANKSTNEQVTVNSLFRVASVSKPITAIAIMKLVEEKKLSLDDKVFGDNSIFGNKYGGKPYRAGYENITVKHILEHTSGLATNDGNDPMFGDFNLTQDQIISNTVQNRDLLTTPGGKNYYSNFGYCVLGRIIEKVSGLSYEGYLQKNILNPIGITKMQVTGNMISSKKENEVVYYNNQNNPYAFNVARMDSHGGIIASSIDLVKLLSRVDGNTVKPDILNAATVALMTKYNATTSYSLGWNVNSNNNWWHLGNITGTSAEIVRANNGFSWAIVANYGCVNCNDGFFGDLDQLGWQIQATVRNWPDYDLF